MLRILLLLGQLLATSLGEGTLPLRAQHLDYAGKVVHPALRTSNFGAFAVGRSYAPIDGRAAILDSQAVRAGQYIHNPSLSAARIQTAGVSRLSPAVYGHADGLYSPFNPALRGLYGPRVGSYYGHYSQGVIPRYDLPGAAPPRPPIRPLPRPIGEVPQTPVDVQQVVKRPLPPRPDPAGLYARPPYGRVPLGPSSDFRGRTSGVFFSAIRGAGVPADAGKFVHPDDPFGLYGTHGLAEAAKRREESRRLALRGQEGRLNYGRYPTPHIRPAVPAYSHSPFSFYGHSYGRPFDHYGQHSYGHPFGHYGQHSYGHPFGHYGHSYGQPFSHYGAGRYDPRFRGPLPAPQGAAVGQYRSYFDRTRLLDAYRPGSLVSPYSYNAAYGFAGQRAVNYRPYLDRPGYLHSNLLAGRYPGPNPYIPAGGVPYAIPRHEVKVDQVKRPLPPPIADRVPPPPPPPQDPIKVPQQVVVPDGRLAGVVANPAFYQPRRLPELVGRGAGYQELGYPQPRRLGEIPSRYSAVYRGAAVFSGDIPQYAGPAAFHIPAHYSPLTKVGGPLVHHNPLFPAVTHEEAAQKSILAAQAGKA